MKLANESTFLKKLFTTRLGQGGLFMVGGSFVVGFVSFLLNPVMGNFLGPHRYGELIALLSLQLIFSVPSLTLNTILVREAARFQANNQFDQLGQLFGGVTSKLLYVSVIAILLFWMGKGPLAGFLQVEDQNLIVFLGVLTMVTFFFTVNGAILQGILKFEIFTLASLLNSILRVLLAVLLVAFGFGVAGALGGLILALVAAYLLELWALRKIVKPVGGDFDWRKLTFAAGPAFVSLLGLTLLNNLDVVLVKHFFTPVEAGYYGAAAIASRLIIFASLPITQVGFPIITQRFEAKKDFRHLVNYAILLISTIGIGVSALYFLLPNLVLKIFFFNRSSEFAGAESILGLVGVYVTLFSLNTFLIYLFLGLHKVRFAWAPLLLGILQGIIIWFNHGDLKQIIWINILINLTLMVILLIYYSQDKKKWVVIKQGHR